jgi:predicted lipid carrier protein YhbT
MLPRDTGSRRVLFVHAGLPKTGTSYLQNVVWDSREELAAQGVALLPVERTDHRSVALSIRNMFHSFDDEWMREVMDRLAVSAAENTAGRALLSQEALAPTKPEQAQLLLDAIGDYEVHVIVTVRDPARQIPSAWQQRIQARATYDAFVDAVFAREPLAADFWANQDLVDVLTRWSATVPPERIHVVTCPPSGGPRGVLLERFCSVLGVDPASLVSEQSESNVALGQVQAELMRRVSVALGDRFPHSRAGFLTVGQSFLADRILRPLAGRPAKLASSRRAETEQLVRTWREFLTDGGFDIVGDLDDLDPVASSFEDVPVPITDSEVAEVAALAIAEILDLRWTEVAERRELLARVTDLEARLDHARSPKGAVRSLGRAALQKNSSGVPGDPS